MNFFATLRKFALPCALAIGCRVQAVDLPAAAPSVTAREFYNAGAKLLAAKNFAEAEKMFQSALAAQDERVQPPALYNLGHARFAEGVELLKKGPDAQKVAAQGNAALAAGEHALRQGESSLAENNLEKMVATYLEGRGARHQLRDAEKAVAAAMETYGKTLQKWQRAADDFKGAAELNPADTNATHNAKIVERSIAKLVDSLRQMQEMMGAMGKQKQDLGKMLSKLKGQIPAPNAPPGAAGDDDEDEPPTQPDSLAGQKENAPQPGDQMQMPLSPEQAGEILEGLSLDGTRRLAMSDKEGAPPKDRKGRNW
jgi:tetratricopeptide (TPR) repeat protein